MGGDEERNSFCDKNETGRHKMVMEFIFTVIVLAFICEFIDSTLGMGYGTTQTPILLLMGFDPLQIVPAVLLSELFTGISAGLAHHNIGNVDLKPGSLHFRIFLVLSICSIFGVLIAVLITVNTPKIILKTYIGVLVLTIGVVMLITIKRRKTHLFSWKKIAGLGILASFNKGISGGGYGPIICGGQILSGVEGKNAVGVTSFAEGLTCFVGVLAFLFTVNSIDWILAPSLITGAMLSVPAAALAVKRIDTKGLTFVIGVATVILGSWTLADIHLL